MSIVNYQDEIHKMAQSNVIEKRLEAANKLKVDFKSLSIIDKKQAWQDMIELMQDGDLKVRIIILESLKSSFTFIPNDFKVYAWEKLMQYMDKQCTDDLVLNYVVEVLGCGFSSLPNNYKSQAWQDLIRLAQMNSKMRDNVVVALYSALNHVPTDYKKQANQDYDQIRKDMVMYL